MSTVMRAASCALRPTLSALPSRVAGNNIYSAIRMIRSTPSPSLRPCQGLGGVRSITCESKGLPFVTRMFNLTNRVEFCPSTKPVTQVDVARYLNILFGRNTPLQSMSLQPPANVDAVFGDCVHGPSVHDLDNCLKVIETARPRLSYTFLEVQSGSSALHRLIVGAMNRGYSVLINKGQSS